MAEDENYRVKTINNIINSNYKAIKVIFPMI